MQTTPIKTVHVFCPHRFVFYLAVMKHTSTVHDAGILQHSSLLFTRTPTLYVVLYLFASVQSTYMNMRSNVFGFGGTIAALVFFMPVHVYKYYILCG